ncbi:MAG: efflux transporter periplasmic adaptor subunit [Cereibacter sphaeroides]|uniref:Efflux transporter periplasmic adaptor subunit n=1 Tax=Cereibacter sphaeroides TaxID=1063 RepID=A0A2W5TJ48_CERSP|nr:MAG: efflux transporter periplasmic adaptor subunit [Cereibacter sphaeroides]
MMKRLLLLAAFCLPLPALSQTQAPPEVTVASPIKKQIVEDDEFVGRFDAASTVDVRSRVSGYLQEAHFRDGSLVKQGDLLFTIDQRLFKVALNQAQSQIGIAQSVYDFTKEQLDRATALVGKGNIPQSTVDERRQAFLTATGNLERSRQDLESAKINLDFSQILAPIAGRIGRSEVTAGNLVRADDTVLTSIVSIDPIYFYFDIDERYYLAYAKDARERGASLQEGGGGLDIRVSLSDARLGPFAGKLDFSENRIDAATGSMRMRAVVPNPDGVITPGLFGRINVPGSPPYPGILIPDAAIVGDQNRQLVMTVDAEGKVTPKVVRPGPRIDGYRVIREGLDGSETIVIEGLMRARPGATVTPVRKELPLVAENAPAAGN